MLTKRIMIILDNKFARCLKLTLSARNRWKATEQNRHKWSMDARLFLLLCISILLLLQAVFSLCCIYISVTISIHNQFNRKFHFFHSLLWRRPPTNQQMVADLADCLQWLAVGRRPPLRCNNGTEIRSWIVWCDGARKV